MIKNKYINRGFQLVHLDLADDKFVNLTQIHFNMGGYHVL